MLLSSPLANELTRWQALRFGALLHDIAKSRTAVPNPKGGYGFPGHDREGAVMVREILTRLRTSEQLKRHVADLTRHHLRAGFLVHHRVGGERLPARTVFAYLKATEPVAVDVTLLSLADRLATRGRKHGEAIARHEEVVGDLLGPALAAVSPERVFAELKRIVTAEDAPRGLDLMDEAGALTWPSAA